MQADYLVTGAGGFLGSALTRRLAQDHGVVRALVRRPEQAEAISGPRIDPVVADLNDKDSIRMAVTGVRYVFHCAATSTDWAHWEHYFASNVSGTEQLATACSGANALQRFVHISTTDVYGYPAQPCSEEVPTQDVGLPYNRTKIQGEGIVWRIAETTGLPVTVLRPATIFGPGSRDFVTDIADALSQKMMLLIDDGRAPGGFIYIDNAVDAIIASGHSSVTQGQVYNLRDESTETWRQYVHGLADALELSRPWLRMPFALAYGFGALMESVHAALRIKAKPLLTRHAVLLMSRDAAFPIDKARRDFGFQSTVGFADGILRSASWYRSETASTSRRFVR